MRSHFAVQRLPMKMPHDMRSDRGIHIKTWSRLPTMVRTFYTLPYSLKRIITLNIRHPLETCPNAFQLLTNFHFQCSAHHLPLIICQTGRAFHISALETASHCGAVFVSCLFMSYTQKTTSVYIEASISLLL